MSKTVTNGTDIVTTFEDNVIKKLEERGIDAMTIVGGAVVTKEFSEKIHADEYGGDALGAVDKIKRLVALRREKK
ncbi:unnamed protein product [marine sediment metagenome]|uniref:B12-binding domain-containing protein n=1 Tax=marine sediment metagenome TaxID=412755 RepID=X1BP45_9ZZZZ